MENLWLPDSIVMKPMGISRGGYAYYMDESDAVRGFVRCAEASAFGTFSAIEVERAKESRFVHLRFRHTNKYWGRQVNQGWIIATSDQPIEDRSKAECTLFEPTQANDGRFLLHHVQSGGRVVLNNVQTGHLSSRLYCFDGPVTDISFNLMIFDFVNSKSLTKVPRRVAFKGDNGRFLRAATVQGAPHLQFSSEDPNERESAFETELNDDGHIRIKSTHLDRYLRRNASTNWILGDTTDNTGDDTLFWPVHVSGATYALRAAGNNNFCRRFTDSLRTSCLSATVSNVTRTSELLMQELVLERHIYHIRFRMDQLRIFDEHPFIAGVGISVNNSDQQSTLTIRVAYEETTSYFITNGEAETSGVSATISVSIPKVISTGVELWSEETKSFEWGEVVEETKRAEAEVTVTVPPRSRVRVDYVGTQATCSIPFTYTQRDKSSSDGAVVAHSNFDGLFEGVNYHSFHFDHTVVEKLPT